MTKAVQEIAYFTSDVAAMAAFYTQLLGAPAITESDHMAIFQVGATELFIHAIYTPGADALPPENHVAFSVADSAATCARLAAQDWRVEQPPQTYYSGRSAYVRDPDGHLIELVESE